MNFLAQTFLAIEVVYEGLGKNASQQTFTRLNSPTEALEKGKKYARS